MVKADIVERVCRRLGVPRAQAEIAVDRILAQLKQALAEGDRIELRGFGVFDVRRRKPGIGRNPRTGDEVPIPAGRAARFRPGKALADLSRDR